MVKFEKIKELHYGNLASGVFGVWVCTSDCTYASHVIQLHR